MINDKWLIALAKCRQIARQMGPSHGRDGVLDVLILNTIEFDPSIDGSLRYVRNPGDTLRCFGFPRMGYTLLRRSI